MNDSKWPEVVGLAFICGFGAVLARGWPTFDGHGWEALAGLGTIAAAGVALFIPMWQNKRRKRDDEVETARLDVYCVEDAFRLFGRLRRAFFQPTSHFPITAQPSRRVIDDLVLELRALQNRVYSRHGRFVMSQLVVAAAAAQDAVHDVTSFIGLPAQSIELRHQFSVCDERLRDWRAGANARAAALKVTF